MKLRNKKGMKFPKGKNIKLSNSRDSTAIKNRRSYMHYTPGRRQEMDIRKEGSVR